MKDERTRRIRTRGTKKKNKKKKKKKKNKKKISYTREKNLRFSGSKSILQVYSRIYTSSAAGDLFGAPQKTYIFPGIRGK